MNSHEVFIHIHQGCFAGTGAIVRLPQCQWSKPDGYGKSSQCITTTKHSKAKTVCIFLGIYCRYNVCIKLCRSRRNILLSHVREAIYAAVNLGSLFIDTGRHGGGVIECTTPEALSAFSWHRCCLFQCQRTQNQVFISGNMQFCICVKIQYYLSSWYPRNRYSVGIQTITIGE